MCTLIEFDLLKHQVRSVEAASRETGPFFRFRAKCTMGLYENRVFVMGGYNTFDEAELVYDQLHTFNDEWCCSLI